MIEAFLSFSAFLYSFAVKSRHWLYDRGLLPTYTAALPVISVGNLLAGGSGKTPVVLFLAKQLEKKYKVAILTRGYKGRAEYALKPLLVEKETPAALAGDEAKLLARRLKHTLVFSNQNRLKSAQAAARAGAELLILDDGMQHRRVRRDFELVVIYASPCSVLEEPFLPKGRLRDDPQRLQCAHLIVFMGEPDTLLKTRIAALTKAPQVVVQPLVTGMEDLEGKPYFPNPGERVALFCGMANPERFVKTIEALSLQVVATHFSPDHRLISEKNLYQFAMLARRRGATLLICTEKDQVKFSAVRKAHARGLALPITWVRTELEIIENQEAWNRALEAMGKANI